MIVLSLLYAALAVVEIGLIIRYVKAGPPATEAEAKAPLEPAERDAGRSDDGPGDDDAAERPLSFAY